MKGKRVDERTAQMVALRRQRKTYAEIGAVFGLCRERVRQIITEAAPELCQLPQLPRRVTGRKRRVLFAYCGLRQCFMCKVTYPASTKHFYRNGKYLTTHCKGCETVRHRAWAEKNRIHLQRYHEEYREKNVERIDEYLRGWQQSNPEKVRQYQRTKEARRSENPKWRINRSVSVGIRDSLKGGKNGRPWESLVGYTLGDLMSHLEAQFSKGMTWDNYGEWHIDHIRPVASFNFSSTEDPDFKACWSLWNLQPLWGIDNIRKGARCLMPPLPLT